MGKKKLPKFGNEAEEAHWYAEHQAELDDYFEPVPDDEAEAILARLPQRSVARAQARSAGVRYKARTTPTSIRFSEADVQAAKVIAEKKGLGYQTWIKMVVRQAIEAEKSGRKRKPIPKRRSG